MPAATAPIVYRVATAAEFVASGLARSVEAAPAAPAPDPIPRYGEIRTHSIGHKSMADPVVRLVLPDAVVHGADGVVTAGRYVLAESLARVVPAQAGAWRDGAHWITLHHEESGYIAEAEHLLCGDPGNYYHWLLDGVARASVLHGAAIPVLVPGLDLSFHAGAEAVLPTCVGPAIALSAGRSVRVGRLGWTSSLTNFGAAFHPALRRLTPAASSPGPTSIYLSRREADRRVLRNEAAVEALCAARGFSIVVPETLSVADQIAVFASARRIVAPHGAALANLLFCRPGAAVLELLMDNYVNFCFRQLAACMGLRYGCVLGRGEAGDPAWVHATQWSVDLARVAMALDDSLFAAEAGDMGTV